ncbi:MAG TPA: DinB family protein [Thermoanaerobaculia bacterium]|nr:DinB family protein [Thermoanaerobaculia bacterium]
MRPSPAEYAAPHQGYVELVPEEEILPAIEAQSTDTQKLLATLDETRGLYRYGDAKWSVKEVLGHIADSERILSYRALAIARGETQPLPGYDEDEYVRTASFDSWKLGDLSEYYALVRRATIVFFRNLPEEAWMRSGTANGFPVTVRGLAWVIVGHERHHLKVLRDRYKV